MLVYKCHDFLEPRYVQISYGVMKVTRAYSVPSLPLAHSSPGQGLEVSYDLCLHSAVCTVSATSCLRIPYLGIAFAEVYT